MSKKMKNIIIVGARGAGRECHNMILLRSDYGSEMVIKGFLDDKHDALDGFDHFAPILDSPENYVVAERDLFICALGDPMQRKKYVDIIRKKGGRFLTLISESSIIHPGVNIGEGSMVGSFSVISSNVHIGAFTMIQSHCVLGHDTIVGDFCTLGSFSFMGGYAVLEDQVTLHPRATVLSKVVVGTQAVVGAGSVAIRHVKAHTTVFGVPAKTIVSSPGS